MELACLFKRDAAEDKTPAAKAGEAVLHTAVAAATRAGGGGRRRQLVPAAASCVRMCTGDLRHQQTAIVAVAATGAAAAGAGAAGADALHGAIAFPDLSCDIAAKISALASCLPPAATKEEEEDAEPEADAEAAVARGTSGEVQRQQRPAAVTAIRQRQMLQQQARALEARHAWPPPPLVYLSAEVVSREDAHA